MRIVLVENMAYVRREADAIEVAHPLKRVWAAVPIALMNLGWSLEKIDDTTHKAKAKTKTSLMSYGTILLIEAKHIDQANTEVVVGAETPVTTITALVDFGQTRKRIELFFLELERQLSQSEKTTTPE
jgi:hypothetical protein